MFLTNWVGADVFNPLVNNMVNGKGKDGGWFGWPDVPKLEELRTAYATSQSLRRAEGARRGDPEASPSRKVIYAPIGQYFVPTAWSQHARGRGRRRRCRYFWNITKN